jgi:ribosomal protein L21E
MASSRRLSSCWGVYPILLHRSSILATWWSDRKSLVEYSPRDHLVETHVLRTQRTSFSPSITHIEPSCHQVMPHSLLPITHIESSFHQVMPHSLLSITNIEPSFHQIMQHMFYERNGLVSVVLNHVVFYVRGCGITWWNDCSMWVIGRRECGITWIPSCQLLT